MHVQLADLPVLVAALLIVALIPGLVIASLVMLRRRVGFETLVVNNEVAGFKYATLGVAYAVLTTFLLVAVWDRFEQAEEAVDRESTALLSLHQLSETLPPTHFQPIRDHLAAYLERVLAAEVPSMQAGAGVFDEGAEQLDPLGRTILHTAASPELPAPVLHQLIAVYLDVIEARRARIAAADGALPALLWWMVVIGGLITVGFTVFFASPNFIAQAAMSGLLSAVIMSLVFATIMVNHPFVGDIAVDLSPYQEVHATITGSG